MISPRCPKRLHRMHDAKSHHRILDLSPHPGRRELNIADLLKSGPRTAKNWRRTRMFAHRSFIACFVLWRASAFSLRPKADVLN